MERERGHIAWDVVTALPCTWGADNTTKGNEMERISTGERYL